MAQSAPTTAQTIEAYVGETMDAARMGPIHWQVLALVASGLFFDVLDFTIFGALVPDLIKSGFVTQAQVSWIGSVTVAGLFVGTLGQGEFTDRFGRKAVYQFNLLLFGLATIIALDPQPARMSSSLSGSKPIRSRSKLATSSARSSSRSCSASQLARAAS